MEGEAVGGPVDCMPETEVVQALNEMKTRIDPGLSLDEMKTRKDPGLSVDEMKTRIDPGLSDVSLSLIAASGIARIHVMAEICQRILDEFGMPIEWAL